MKNDKTSIEKGPLAHMTQALGAEGFKPDSSLLSSLIHSLPLNVYAKDREGRFIFANGYYCHSIGRTCQELIGKSDYDIHPRELAEKYRSDDRRIMESRQTETIDEPWRAKDGEPRYTRVIKTPLYDNAANEQVIGTVGIFWDITRQKQAEEERRRFAAKLLHSQKMETVGTLAGGIAHDFNNLLMGVQGRISLMAAEIDDSHQFWESIKEIEELVASATGLTGQLLGFARGGKYQIKPTELNEFIDKTGEMFGRTHKEIRIRKTFAAALWAVEIDRYQMEQVLMNMFVNAWQAMPDGGDLYLKTENMHLDATEASPHAVEAGRYVKISITDTGVGMDAATRRRIFDPFFTTKEIGRGTGLGLASGYGIIKNHGGFINVYSEPGRGSTFSIYLPASDKAPLRDGIREQTIIKGSETILLVDDEEIIIDIGKIMLEKIGYQVLVANSGKAALKSMSEMGGDIDLVILDLIMPGMDGGETFDGIRDIDPAMPVLLSSGYSINGQASDIMKKGCNGFIQKPFQISEISQLIRKILDGK